MIINAVSLYLVRPADKSVFLVDHKKHGCWLPIGGKCNDKEDIYPALEREAFEEARIPFHMMPKAELLGVDGIKDLNTLKWSCIFAFAAVYLDKRPIQSYCDEWTHGEWFREPPYYNTPANVKQRFRQALQMFAV